MNTWNNNSRDTALQQTSEEDNIHIGTGQDSWNLEEEIAKVVENGAALGVDFNKKDTDGWNIVVEIAKSTLFILWCLGGDFNIVLDPSESRGGGSDMGSIRFFHDFVRQAMVVDISIRGVSFTCTNNWERVSWVGSIVKEVNFSFITLIPRCANPDTMSDFRPISLVSSMYKLRKKSGGDSDWAKVFKCQKACLPIMYLGLPLGARPRAKSFWNPVIRRVESRLTSCKRKFLNKEGRVVLIKAVLASIHTYYMLAFKVPIGIEQALEKTQRSFLWGDGSLKRKSSEWPRLEADRYCQSTPFMKVVGSLFVEGSASTKILGEGLKMVIGNRNKTNFWSDVWWDNSLLKMLARGFLLLAVNKVGFVSNFGRLVDSKWEWKVMLRHPLFDWEQDQWKCFISILNNIVIRRDIQARILLPEFTVQMGIFQLVRFGNV
ncbi:hypothetical protein Dsin_027802 [Dipteronia sinensis]|uniref:Uncharacterized protein n=1 Tax=Dipteronia sinensis TaxID=43782 RepID=A0AAD9ZR20_9ROSI|nr:hypothetical protein Dsin_027802 [Dipteronia sinensis]